MAQQDELPDANTSPDHYVPGEELFETEVACQDQFGLENVEGFSFLDPDWKEDINIDKLEIVADIGTLSYERPESVCGSDDRVKIKDTTATPYRFICKLFIEAANGRNYIGSGFFIGPRCVITSGHVVHSNGGWAKSITVVPGMNGSTAPFGKQVSRRFFSVKGWTQKKDPNYDHAAIILPDNTLYNRVRGFFGYRQENGLPMLNNSGYPRDKTPSTEQWYNAGRATKNTTHRFEYMLDTYGGQSGSPTWLGGASGRVAVGVHGYGGCPNKCIRAQGYVLQRWGEWRQK